MWAILLDILGNCMTRDTYAKIVFNNGVIHIIPVWDDAMTPAELTNRAIEAGLDYNGGEFTITVMHTG